MLPEEVKNIITLKAKNTYIRNDLQQGVYEMWDGEPPPRRMQKQLLSLSTVRFGVLLSSLKKKKMLSEHVVWQCFITIALNMLCLYYIFGTLEQPWVIME